MGGDLGPGDRLGQAPNQTRTPAIQILSVGLPRTEALPVANGRHQTVRSGGDWGRNLFGIKNRKLKLADRDVSGETSAVDLGGAPGGASFEHHSKSENTEPTPRSSISSFGPWTVHSGAGPISPGLGDRIFRGAHTTTWLTALEFGFRNRRGRWAPQPDHRHRVLRSPGGFSRSSIYGRSNELSRRRRTRLRQQAHFLLRLSMKATSIWHGSEDRSYQI
jgi:hypothetical protein